jgi:hypothetical protein
LALRLLDVVGLGRWILALRQDRVDDLRLQSICRGASLETRREHRRHERD